MKNLSSNEKFQALCQELYGAPSAYQQDRYQAVIDNFSNRFGKEAFRVFSSPGRTEISGNHTDHNGGKVLTASVTVDAICAASKSGNSTITVYSDGYEEPFVIDIQDTSVRVFEKGKGTRTGQICERDRDQP